MKKLTLFCFISAMFGMGLTEKGEAQTGNTLCTINGTPCVKDTVARLTLFTGRSLEGKVYLHWNVADQHADGIYLVYRSMDGENFTMVGQKSGIGTPHCMDIAYYFTDEFNSTETAYYKIMHISRQQTYMISEEIAVAGTLRPAITATK